MPSQFRARVPEGSITGWLAGDGPPALVLHGGPGHFPWFERPGSVRKPLERVRGEQRADRR